MKKPSVIIIRESEEQVAASGCCGKFEGDFARCSGEWVFPERRRIKERTGEVARWLHDEFGDTIDLAVVDPRNQLCLLLKIVGDVWHFRPPLWPAIRSLCMAFAFPAVLVNGKVTFSRNVPARDDVVPAVLAAMSRA